MTKRKLIRWVKWAFTEDVPVSCEIIACLSVLGSIAIMHLVGII